MLVALVVAAVFHRTRLAWLAVAIGYLTSVVLSGDFAFEPLTAARKVLLAGLAGAVVGLALDLYGPRLRRLPILVSVLVGLAATWVFASILVQQDRASMATSAGAMVVFVTLLVYLVLALREDGIRMGAAGLGLGVGVGVSAVLSASIGYLLGGIAVAAASGALLLVQIVARRDVPAGYTGGVTIGLLVAYFALATLLLASQPWYALPLLLLVPLAARLPLPASGRFVRAAIVSLASLLVSLLPIAAAWYAARGPAT